jgi:hypothetical protein
MMRRAAWLAATLVPLAAVASADSWAPPKVTAYESSGGAYRFTVVPRGLSSAGAFFADKMEGREPAGAKPEGAQECTGTLEKKTQDGTYARVWSRRLTNEVAPVRALVAASGAYVVTLDNWHFLGHGRNVVVIYGAGGKIVRELSLTDFVPPEDLTRLPQTVSSIHWGGEHTLDESRGQLVLRVVSNGEMPYDDSARFREVRLELATGRVVESPRQRP